MDAPLLAADFKFMFFGMGMAFLLLAIIKIKSALVRKFFSQAVAEEKSVSIPTQDVKVDKKVVAAITAAIIHHREGK